MVCLFPVNQFDLEFLKKWFDKVMVAHNGLFFVIAVSVTIMFATGMPHACYYLIYVTHKVVS